MNLSFAAKLLGGQIAGRGRILCPGPGHSANDRSLSVSVLSESFVVHSFAGDDWKLCRDYVAARLNLRHDTNFGRPSRQISESGQKEDFQRLKKAEDRALACWREAKFIKGSIAEGYLRGRGITCDLSDTLRFHPNCVHPSRASFPAMVALVEGSGKSAIHRTYLQTDGSGKAAVSPAKAMLGGVSGGAVRLSAGEEKLVVCEGIETGLSLLSGLLPYSATVWAALSTSGMKTLTLPANPGRLTIAVDGDNAGRSAANQLAERATTLGWSVSLLPAPEGQDFNDVLAMKGNSE